MDTETTDQKQSQGKPWQFAPGQSGNPGGRPKGSRNSTTLAVQALLDGEAEAISRKAVELAKKGDITAIRLVLERVLPPRRDMPVTLDLPKLEKAGDAVKALAALLEGVGNGELTPGEAHTISGLIETYRRMMETEELEKRISKLEEKK